MVSRTDIGDVYLRSRIEAIVEPVYASPLAGVLGKMGREGRRINSKKEITTYFTSHVCLLSGKFHSMTPYMVRTGSLWTMLNL